MQASSKTGLLPDNMGVVKLRLANHVPLNSPQKETMEIDLKDFSWFLLKQKFGGY